MNISTFNDKTPLINHEAWIHASAVIIGDVTINAHTSIWPLVVLRGDVNSIHIGERTSIQDGSVIHVTHQGPYHKMGCKTMIGDDVTIGHRVILHGCTIKSQCLIGMGSCVMDDVIIESQVILGAGSLVPPNKVLDSGYLWMGSPARRVRPLTEKEIESIYYSAQHYVKLKNQYV